MLNILFNLCLSLSEKIGNMLGTILLILAVN